MTLLKPKRQDSVPRMTTSPRPSTLRQGAAFVRPKEIRPPLKACPRNTKRRRTLGKIIIATDTPEKDKIEEKRER